MVRTAFLRLPPRATGAVRRLPLAGPLLHRLSHRVSPAGARSWVQTRSGPAAGLWLELDPRFERDFWRGEHEREVVDTALALLSEGDVVYDVGAHIGVFALVAARAVGPAGTVFAFEPDERNATAIERHAACNGLRNVTVVRAAAWSRSGRIAFDADEVHEIRSYGAAGSGEAEVDAVALDDFAEAHAPPALVKIDVEGGELDVLDGAGRLVGARRAAVLCEVHPAAEPTLVRAEDVAARFAAAGYRVERLTPGAEPTHLLCVPSS